MASVADKPTSGRNWGEWFVDRIVPGLMVAAIISSTIYLYGATRVSLNGAVLGALLPRGTIILLAQATGDKKCPDGFDYLESVGIDPSPTASEAKTQGDRIGTAGGKLWPLLCVKS